jgi:hypothetical protein
MLIDLEERDGKKSEDVTDRGVSYSGSSSPG